MTVLSACLTRRGSCLRFDFQCVAMDSDFFIKAKAQRDLPPFRYFDQGSLAVIGRWAAVANAFGFISQGSLPGLCGPAFT